MESASRERNVRSDHTSREEAGTKLHIAREVPGTKLHMTREARFALAKYPARATLCIPERFPVPVCPPSLPLSVVVRIGTASPSREEQKTEAPLRWNARYASRWGALFMAGSLFGVSYKSKLCNREREEAPSYITAFIRHVFLSCPWQKSRGARGLPKKSPHDLTGHFFKGSALLF